MQVQVQQLGDSIYRTTPITVQRFDESSWCCGADVKKNKCTDCGEEAEPRHELIWCSHTNTVETEFDNGYFGYSNGDPDYIENWQMGEICAKSNCGAKRLYGEDWQDAPFEGVHHG